MRVFLVGEVREIFFDSLISRQTVRCADRCVNFNVVFGLWFLQVLLGTCFAERDTRGVVYDTTSCRRTPLLS